MTGGHRKHKRAASRPSWNGAGMLRAGRDLMESRTGHPAGGSAEMPPPPDEEAIMGRQADPGPPIGNRRSAVSAMARLRLARRSLRPGRAKCARSDPHHLPLIILKSTTASLAGCVDS